MRRGFTSLSRCGMELSQPARPPTDDEIVREVEKKLEGPSLEERLSEWKKPLKDSTLQFFGGKLPTFFEHKVGGLKPDQMMFQQAAMYASHHSGKTMFLQNVIREAQQRGIKAVSMIHDELQLEGKKEDIEEMKKKLGLG
jgi:hypothetical protein